MVPDLPRYVCTLVRPDVHSQVLTEYEAIKHISGQGRVQVGDLMDPHKYVS